MEIFEIKCLSLETKYLGKTVELVNKPNNLIKIGWLD